MTLPGASKNFLSINRSFFSRLVSLSPTLITIQPTIRIETPKRVAKNSNMDVPIFLSCFIILTVRFGILMPENEEISCGDKLGEEACHHNR